MTYPSRKPSPPPTHEPKESQATHDPDENEDDEFVECPIEDCGEFITLAELEDHVQLHSEETQSDSASIPTTVSSPPRNDSRPTSTDTARSSESRRVRSRKHIKSAKQSHAIEAWKRLFHVPSTVKDSGSRNHSSSPPGIRKRLGKSELGKYAHEDKMPDWLVALLKKGKYVKSEGMIFVLEQLLAHSSSTEWAFLCHPCVQHISKLRREGGFCGYRNIQMLCSYMIGVETPDSAVFRGKIPSIFRIQDHIEDAWDLGINENGRAETGGVKGSRKYIGTPEAQAMLVSLGIHCEAQGFKNPEASVAETALLHYVQDYFSTALFDPDQKVRLTDLPPIYFQHRGHSMTIIGLERRTSGELQLLVFDPMFHDPAYLTGPDPLRRTPSRNSQAGLKFYRRGHNYLKKYHEFEVLALLGPQEDTAQNMYYNQRTRTS
ncbi:peptidase family C78-domain-containing protein [Microdochium trichocladiopsis]|uniref:Peptidase family C78-domain-containing protein n=1 Tax=Microdochium trichocladiopsis TaxID=1682393 RepID=A0A9P8Y8W7_9PEZI|nr:peptidase family C78-domain-containing protein [Microdochium trichocladiopsis]KAH7033334.1 peptidase family C78-domain-containing protein [Microdochium trichocladiopsis]